MTEQTVPVEFWLEIGLLEEALEDLNQISFANPLRYRDRMKAHDRKIEADTRIRAAIKNLKEKQSGG